MLVDTSVLARLGKPEVLAAVRRHLSARTVLVSGIAELEFLRGARSADEYAADAARLASTFPRAPADEIDVVRAREVQAAMSPGARHRAVAIPDLLMAATAERLGLAVLHYDADFDRIAEVTDQPTEWVVPRGTAD